MASGIHRFRRLDEYWRNENMKLVRNRFVRFETLSAIRVQSASIETELSGNTMTRERRAVLTRRQLGVSQRQPRHLGVGREPQQGSGQAWDCLITLAHSHHRRPHSPPLPLPPRRTYRTNPLDSSFRAPHTHSAAAWHVTLRKGEKGAAQQSIRRLRTAPIMQRKGGRPPAHPPSHVQ